MKIAVNFNKHTSIFPYIILNIGNGLTERYRLSQNNFFISLDISNGFFGDNVKFKHRLLVFPDVTDSKFSKIKRALLYP